MKKGQTVIDVTGKRHKILSVTGNVLRVNTAQRFLHVTKVLRVARRKALCS